MPTASLMGIRKNWFPCQQIMVSINRRKASHFPSGLIEVTGGSVVARWPPLPEFDPVTHFLLYLSTGPRGGESLPEHRECRSVCVCVCVRLHLYVDLMFTQRAPACFWINQSCSCTHTHAHTHFAYSSVTKGVLSSPAINLYQTRRKKPQISLCCPSLFSIMISHLLPCCLFDPCSAFSPSLLIFLIYLSPHLSSPLSLAARHLTPSLMHK